MIRITHWDGVDGQTHYQASSEDIQTLCYKILDALVDANLIQDVTAHEDIAYDIIHKVVDSEIDNDYVNYN